MTTENEKIVLPIDVAIPKPAEKQSTVCPICEFWNKHPIKMRHSTPVYANEVHEEIVTGFWMGLTIGLGYANGPEGAPKPVFCMTHSSMLKYKTEKENLRLAEAKQKAEEERRAAEYQKHLDAITSKPEGTV